MTNILVKLNSNLSNVTEKKLFPARQCCSVVPLSAFRLFYITQSSEMFAEHEINAGEKCGEKVAMLVLNLVQNYTAYVDKGLRLPLG